MHYIILATMRITLAALILLGVGFLLLVGILNITRELFADDRNEQPQFSESEATAGFGHTD